MKILFHDNYLCERGTAKALYDYADYNEKILNNESIITYNASNTHNVFSVIDKFNKRFKVVPYYENNKKHVNIDKIVFSENIDLFYAIKGGEHDEIYTTECKNLMHCVFTLKYKHGDVYASICEYMSSKHGNIFPFVHHIIEDKSNISDNYRNEFGIPTDAIVLGRYGAYDTFSIPFVKEEIANALNTRKDLWFVFLNTSNFINHERVKYLPMTIDESLKCKFINTCDAMIHARLDGEVFSLSVAEFSIKNKPIITWNPVNIPSTYDIGHIFSLKDKGIYYKDRNDIKDIFLYLNKSDIEHKNWDAYSETFSAKNVMNEFKNVFIERKYQ